MNHTFKRILTLITIFLFFYLWLTPVVFASEQNTETVKVGYYEDGDYMSLNQQGEYVGYNIEYIQELAKNSDLQFEIVDTGSWNAAYDMLVRGEIDLLPSVYHTEERAEEVLFVTQPMCSIYTTLNVRMDDERYAYDDFTAFEGMNVGIIRGGIDGERFKEFCKNNGVVLNIIEYDETDKLLGALEDGTLDGVAITHLGKNSSFRSVAQFSPSPLFLTVTAKKPDLLDDLNRAVDNILLSNPSYGADLYDKYLAPSSNQKPVFTKDERQYIEHADPVIVSYDPSFAPLAYQEEKTGNFRGVSADVFQYIAENSGLEFRYEAHPQSDALKLLQQGKIDALCLSDGDYLWDSRNSINSTLYYLRTPTSMITRYDTGAPEILALIEGYQLSEVISNDNPHSKVQYYSTAVECLEAVQKGEADATYINTQVAGFFLNNTDYNGLQEAALGQYINKMCVGVSSGKDSRLYSVINKCIQYLPVEQVDTFMVNNSISAKEVSLAEFVREHMWAVVFGVSLVLFIIILLVSYNLRNALHSNRRIQELLYQDELTGLDSINGFYHKWPQNVSNEGEQNLALLYSDICQFKLINDNFGFAVGDEVLRACSRVLEDELESSEHCARVSADNFVLLMRYTDWDLLIGRLRTCVEKLNRWRTENTDIPYRIELIFGVYSVTSSDKTDIKQMLDFANYARRHAKSTPGSFAVLYDEQMRRQALQARQLEGGLDDALAADEFEVYYQPKVSMSDGEIIGSEALIRWNHPKMGFLMPGTFIPLFEKNGMIKKVDFWLFENVCRTMHGWKEQGHSLLPVSCNFSRLHFEQQDFPERICEIADRWRIPHELLEIEITESALIDDSGKIERMLPRLKALWFKIAIDDFGSGYSSLGQLRQLPADVLKLDRSFVCHGVAGKREQIVVESIIRMAGELGITVICEGVEDRIQSEILQDMGCRLAQGFYFYRPMDMKSYEKLIM
ncbi:EAL domain-containing protein [Ruminococcus sp. OA3]|uniref:EAL domain-containing protein n=1 Tax=Ruminococcus sp. OA3 TaxID=2914164 RepID=UPI001F0682C4|nr:EAL domain-containing protein [Ruminococcus sp. OA3]MCH1983038.1 EAL domain-containing protein [Ruminococcus sp. OA3]